MRITVSHVLEMLAGRMMPEQVLQENSPILKKPTFTRVLKYAGRHVAHREIPLTQ